MAKNPKTPPVDDKKIIDLLQRYACPVPYHEVRTRFLGNMATPEMSVSPISIVKGLWGGKLPEFENMEAVNELLDVLINGLWNSLTRHQKRTEPFRLIRRSMDTTRTGLAAYALMRQQEIDGFVDGLFNGEESIDLPEKAYASIDVISEIRAMLGGVYALTTDAAKPAPDRDLAVTIKHLQELTPIIEHEINTVVLVCTRARRKMLKASDFPGPTLH